MQHKQLFTLNLSNIKLRDLINYPWLEIGKGESTKVTASRERQILAKSKS